MKIFIIYPNTLFSNISLLEDQDKIFIIEDNTFFKKFNYHKQKLILHRASMKYYYDYLLLNFGTKVFYIDNSKLKLFYNKIFNSKFSISIYDPINHSIIKLLKKLTNNLTIYDNLSFTESYDDLLNYNNTINDNKYRHDQFYKWNRLRLNILLDNDKPLFGKWSFDSENRKPFDKNYINPEIIQFNNDYIIEAKEYVAKNYPNNFGDIDNFIFPITHKQAKKLLIQFIQDKLNNFGKYQDAVHDNIIIGSHSLLSSSLNIGLITAKECLNLILKQFNKLSTDNKKKQINNYEGFLRQLIGWRPYTRLLYEFHGSTMYNMNFLEHNKKITKEWYLGTTKIKPIDSLINKVKKYAYLHHIERLMYIGNWALLTEIHPKEIYKWFMITCIDAYEWVMVSNVHGMSQHALENDKISMMTRPYFSSTNYIKNMSNFITNNNEEWIEIWNNLYYYFIYKNKEYLKKNYSIARQVVHWNNKSKNEQKEIINFAKSYLT